MRLVGKVAFVTGAGGGIGRSICEQFLAEGAKVIATDINLSAAREAVAAAPPEQTLALECDSGDSDAVREAITAGSAKFGLVNVLCAVAGGSSTTDGGVVEAPEDEFWRVIRLDLFGPFLIGKHGIPELIKAGGGSVIMMTSMTAMVGTTGRDCYTAAKGGVASLARSMAVGYADHKIRVNAIAPGLTRTPRVMSREATPERRALEGRHLLGPADPLDVAYMAVYLASEEARVVTGQVLRVDSGATIQ